MKFTRFFKRDFLDDLNSASRGGSLLPTVAAKIKGSRSVYTLLGPDPKRGQRVILLKLDERQHHAAALQATAPVSVYARASHAAALLKLSDGDADFAAELCEMPKAELLSLAAVSKMSQKEREIAAQLQLSERQLLSLCRGSDSDRRRSLVALLCRKRKLMEAAERFNGAKTDIKAPPRKVRDERIVKNTLQNAAASICRAGFCATLRVRPTPQGTEYRILVSPAGTAAASAVTAASTTAASSEVVTAVSTVASSVKMGDSLPAAAAAGD